MLKRILVALGVLVLAGAAFALAARGGMFDIPLEQLRAQYQTRASRYVTVDGVDLHVTDEGQGPVLLLVHGHYQSLRIWDPWVARLKGKVRVIRIDMPPYGLSGPDPHGAYSPQRVERLIAELAARYRLTRFAIGGISTGSAISLRYALAHPDQISGLVLVNAPLVPIPPKLLPKSPWYMQQLEDKVFRPIYRPQAFYTYLFGRLFADPNAVPPTLARETYDMLRKPGNAAALETFTHALRFEAADYRTRARRTTAQLAQVKVPTLILWGGAGSMLPVSVACRVQQGMTGARTRLIVYPHAGHFLPLEAPQAAADIAAFMADPAAATLPDRATAAPCAKPAPPRART